MVSLHLLLRTVATLAQVPAVPVIPTIPVVPQVPVQAAMELARVSGQLSQLSELRDLASFSGLANLTEAGNLAELAQELNGRAGRHSHRSARVTSLPPESWAADDPADSLYRTARELLNRGRYSESANAFADIAKRYPKSKYTPDSYYWQAFSLYKAGDNSKLKQARTVLDYQKHHYPDASTRGDADALYAQVQGALARQGDPDARGWVDSHANAIDTNRVAQSGSCAGGDDDDDPRIAALNALLQMDADRAVPVLKKVLERRDACSVSLRRKAVFIISQQHTAETEDILLSAARNDPDEEVREQAVFWLSQVGSAKATSALDSILLNSSNPDLQKKAVFALSQIDSPEASRMLRDYAEKQSAPVEARADAIFWLSQQGHGENGAYLRTLYGQLNNEDLKDKTIFAVSQIGGADNLNWLMDLAVNEQESVDMRKKALFWAGQSDDVSLERLTGLYDRMKNRDMKEQMIFVYSQRHEGAALDKLIDIAKHDTDPELRKKAIFWIGQSHDPKAAQYLQEVINQ
jgi:hypothetical protein